MTNFPSVSENLGLYIDAGFPILYIYTSEESVVDIQIGAVADRREILEWNDADGFVDFKTKSARGEPNQPLEVTLMELKRLKNLHRKILVIKDAAEYLKSEKVIALLKEISRKIRNHIIDSTIIIVSSKMCIPQELEKLITVMELERPSAQQISEIVINKIGDSRLPETFLDRLSIALKGLYQSEIESLLDLVIAENGEFTEKSLSLINSQKQQMILKSGILEMIPLKESINDIGGLENLKEWLTAKSNIFNNITDATEWGVPMPKGVLIAGIAGCGKSLSAKATGKLFDVPLLRLDMGRLMGKYVGESEENMRKAISLAEAMAPCVLWVDELEKSFAGIGSNGNGSEVTMRLFGAFLTWMQEKTVPVFVVATANDIEKLPPELLRKGRFDEIFYVSLPNSDERKKIFEIHLNKRRRADVPNIKINDIVDKTNGFSGADIESVVGESIEKAFVKKMSGLTTDELMVCIKNTNSLSELMGNQIEKLMKYYEDNNFKKASR